MISLCFASFDGMMVPVASTTVAHICNRGRFVETPSVDASIC